MKKLICVACLVFVAANTKGQQDWDEVKVTSQPVRDNVYMLQGAGGNIGVLTGPDGIVMIDDQFLPLGPKIKEAIAALDKGPIRFTLNTHVHGDHSGGNEYFRDMGSMIVAHELVRDRMIGEPRPEKAWPVVTFPDRMSLHLNGQDIDLIHFEPGHTDGDIIIHFKQANVFHMGDVFVRYGYPYIDIENGGNINGLIATVDKALSLMNDESLVIPGHGDLCKKEEVIRYRDRLAAIRDKVASALKKGTKPEELSGLDITAPYDAEWGKGFIKGKDFVMVVAAGLGAK